MSNLTWVQEFVTKLLSTQSINCMVTKLNNSPGSVTKPLNSQSASCITTRSSFGNRQTGAAPSAMQDEWLTNCMVPNWHSGKLPHGPVWPPLTTNALHSVVKGGRHLTEWQLIKKTLGGNVARSKRYFYLNNTWSNCHYIETTLLRNGMEQRSAWLDTGSKRHFYRTTLDGNVIRSKCHFY